MSKPTTHDLARDTFYKVLSQHDFTFSDAAVDLKKTQAIFTQALNAAVDRALAETPKRDSKAVALLHRPENGDPATARVLDPYALEPGQNMKLYLPTSLE